MKRFAVVALATVAFVAGCQRAPQAMEPVVVARYPHDSSAFTQGLVHHDGRFYESTGLYGESSLREVVMESGEVLRILPLPPHVFAEGLALVDGRLIQLTWRNGAAYVYDADTFERVATLSYDTEGWGLCWDGASLYMSDGTATLARRDPNTFEVLDTVQVVLDGEPVTRLNELECVDDTIYANVFTTDTIVQIDKRSGRVRAEIDAAGLLTESEREGLDSGDVLNGIAHDPVTGRFWLTGKRWPYVFEVEFAPVDAPR